MVDGIEFTTNPKSKRDAKPVLNEILILGNGFDLNLGLKTGFGDYMKWYATTQCHIVESDFENSLESNASDDLRACILSKLDNFWVKLVYGLAWDWTKRPSGDLDMPDMTWGNIEQIISAVLLSSRNHFQKCDFKNSVVKNRMISGYSENDEYWNFLNRDYSFLTLTELDDNLELWCREIHIPTTVDYLDYFDSELLTFEYSFYDYLTNNVPYFKLTPPGDGSNKSQYISDWEQEFQILNLNNNAIANMDSLLHDSIDFTKYAEVHVTVITYNGRYLRNMFYSTGYEDTRWHYDSLHFLNIHGPVAGVLDYVNLQHLGDLADLTLECHDVLRNLNMKRRIVFGVSESFRQLFNTASEDNRYCRFYKSHRLQNDIDKIDSFKNIINKRIKEKHLIFLDFDKSKAFCENDLLTMADFLESQKDILDSARDTKQAVDIIVKSYGQSMSQIDSNYYEMLLKDYAQKNIDAKSKTLGIDFNFEFFQYYNPKVENHKSQMKKALVDLYYFSNDWLQMNQEHFYLKPIDLEVW